RLADTGRSHQEDGVPADNDVLDDVDGAGDSATHPAGEPDDPPGTVADGADAVQGALDPRPVVVSEDADPGGDVVEVGLGDLHLVENRLPVVEARLRFAAEVEDDLEQLAAS